MLDYELLGRTQARLFVSNELAIQLASQLVRLAQVLAVAVVQGPTVRLFHRGIALYVLTNCAIQWINFSLKWAYFTVNSNRFGLFELKD